MSSLDQGASAPDPTSPRRTTRTESLLQPGPATSFETRGANGELVRCDLDLPDAPTWRGFVVLLHGFKGFARWGFFPDLGARLAHAGYAVLRPDLSHNGTGRGDQRSTFARKDLFELDRVSYRLADVNSAIAAALPRVPKLHGLPRALIGHSLGGGLALLAAERMAISNLVTLSAVSTFRFDPESEATMERDGALEVLNQRTGEVLRIGASALRDLRANGSLYDLAAAATSYRGRWLILHGTDDRTVPAKAADVLHAASAGRATVHLVSDADHTFGCRHPFDGPTPAYLAAVTELLTFLDAGMAAQER